MTNFELNGMRRQYDALTEAQANYQFNESCKRCVETGRCWRSCKGCGINVAHEIMINNFKLDKMNREMTEKLIQTNKRLGLT